MERTPKDALMERTRTVISRTYSLLNFLKEPYVLKEPYLKEPYDDEVKDPLRDPDKSVWRPGGTRV